MACTPNQLLAAKKWKEKNKKQVSLYNKQWYLENKEKRRNYKIKYDLEHKEYRDNQKKIWYQENKNRILEEIKNNRNFINKQLKVRRKIDINFKIISNLRHRIYEALKNNYKSKDTLELLGCSIEFLKKYIESQFKPKMSWSNYGKYGWHIDHIKQCALFDLSKPEQQKECFNYKNLRPLWFTDNLSRPKPRIK